MGLVLEAVSIIMVLAYAFSYEAPVDVLYAAGIFALAGAIENGLQHLGSGTLYRYLKSVIYKSNNDTTTK